MKYFIDTEFNEGFRKPISWLPTIGSFNRPVHLIELISIGIVCEDGREYYAVSKEFDLRAAWNKFDLKQDFGKPQGLGDTKVYWLRENVLRPIHAELALRYEEEYNTFMHDAESWFTLPTTQKLINMYGKTRERIAEDIVMFCYPENSGNFRGEEGEFLQRSQEYGWLGDQPEFWAYFADYDWVVFCSIFGRMVDLPKGFPMYCRDLKQTLDEKAEHLAFLSFRDSGFEGALQSLKTDERYPKQENEHNALADAKWNKRLFDFLKKL